MGSGKWRWEDEEMRTQGDEDTGRWGVGSGDGI